MSPADFIFSLVVIFAATKLVGELATRIGQAPVVGELLAGILIGTSVFSLIDPGSEILRLLSELGVIILLFEIGLESDLDELLRVGWQSSLVAITGVALPFLLGYGLMLAVGFGSMTAIFVGATLTATSIGITARVLSDIGKIRSREAQIILGAAVIDDILGLIILSVVQSLAATGDVSLRAIGRIMLLALGFLAAAIWLGRILAPLLVRIASRMRVRGILLIAALSFALALAYLAELAGSAPIIGAFAGGITLAESERRVHLEEALKPLADFFVPIFFALISAAVNLAMLNPFNPANRSILLVGGLLVLAAVVGKWLSGFTVFKERDKLDRLAIGAGMIPRGEVGLIFASVGRSTGVIGSDLYTAIVIMVLLTTLMAPPLLKALMHRRPSK